MTNWTEKQLSYLAGILDGEGCINLNVKVHDGYRDYRIRFYVVNTDPRLIDWLHDTFGGHRYVAKRHNKKHPGWKIKLEWYLTDRSLAKLLPEVMPHLLLKREQAQVALRFLETVGKRPVDWTERDKLVQLMRQLNHREWLAAETKRSGRNENFACDSPNCIKPDKDAEIAGNRLSA